MISIERLNERFRGWLIGGSVLLCAGGALLDALLPAGIAIPVLYLPGIMLACLTMGLTVGIFFSLGCALVASLAADGSGVWSFLSVGSTNIAFAVLLWQWQAARRRQRTLEQRDPLTGLINSRAFFERVNGALRRKPPELGIAFLDCDDFKSVNDEFGHLRGNELLMTLGKCIRDQSRGAPAARMGGDEFALLLEGNASKIAETIDRVREALARDTQKWTKQITFSTGIATAAANTDAESLVRAADDAMYRAKRNGKDRTEVHSTQDVKPLPTG